MWRKLSDEGRAYWEPSEKIGSETASENTQPFGFDSRQTQKLSFEKTATMIGKSPAKGYLPKWVTWPWRHSCTSQMAHPRFELVTSAFGGQRLRV
jgi:hypothetical protein